MRRISVEALLQHPWVVKGYNSKPVDWQTRVEVIEDLKHSYQLLRVTSTFR